MMTALRLAAGLVGVPANIDHPNCLYERLGLVCQPGAALPKQYRRLQVKLQHIRIAVCCFPRRCCLQVQLSEEVSHVLAGVHTTLPAGTEAWDQAIRALQVGRADVFLFEALLAFAANLAR